MNRSVLTINIHDGDWQIFVEISNLSIVVQKKERKKKRERERERNELNWGTMVDYGGANQGFEDTRVYMYKRRVRWRTRLNASVRRPPKAQ